MSPPPTQGREMGSGASEGYGRFAEYYDFIYHDIVDYAGDVDFLEAVFQRKAASRPEEILDLGCGTGNHDLPLAHRGHRVTGLDVSASQLRVARRKAREVRADVRFVQGDMRAFDLGRTFDAAICMFGAFGYLTTSSDVLGCLRSLRRHLRPDGLFVYEFWHTPGIRPRADWYYKAGPRYELIRLSEGRYDARRHLLSIEFRFAVFHGRKVLDRFDESHTLRTYTVPEMRRLLQAGGFRLEAAYAGSTEKKSFRPVRPSTFRIMAVARRHGQS